jgi:hypothetical protein
VCNGKLILFNISCGKFVKEIENLQCKGTISLIQSIDGYLILGEGNKLVIYSINPLKRELTKISEIDNKVKSELSRTYQSVLRLMLISSFLETFSKVFLSFTLRSTVPLQTTISNSSSLYMPRIIIPINLFPLTLG